MQLSESLALLETPLSDSDPDAPGGIRLEFTSRGDRVAALVRLPSDRSRGAPIVLLGHDLASSKEEATRAAAAAWAGRGVAIACIDLPLHGERESDKLSERLFESGDPNGGELAPPSRLLWEEFTRQSIHDLGRALDALSELPQIDAERVIYAGLGLGAAIGALFFAADERPLAAALSLCGAGIGPALLARRQTTSKAGPRPLLVLGSTADPAVTRERAEALHASAPEPRSLEWLEDGEEPAATLEAVWAFVHASLAGG